LGAGTIETGLQKRKHRMPMEPVMRTDDHFKTKHAQILKMGRARNIQVVFLGDSLVRRWEDNIELWDRYFAGYNAANFGMGSDCLENIKWRILHGELEGIAPKILLMLAGTNNLDKDSVETIVSGIGEITAIIRRKLKDSIIVILGLLPRNRNETGLDYARKIGEINKRLRGQYANTEGILFRDVGSDLINAEGIVNEAIMPDGLHLNRAGYEVVGPRLKAIIEELWSK
jgi:platelet-activating factor acetylhydrolase IB subunit beta/gamma